MRPRPTGLELVFQIIRAGMPPMPWCLRSRVIKEQEENGNWERACFAAFKGGLTEKWGSYHHIRKAERLWKEKGPFRFDVKTLTEGLKLTRAQREETERIVERVRRTAEVINRYRHLRTK